MLHRLNDRIKQKPLCCEMHRGSFFIRLFFISQSEDIVRTRFVQFCKFDDNAYGNISESALVLGIERLVTEKILRDLLLRQVAVLAEISYPNKHNHHLIIIINQAVKMLDK